MSTPVSVVGGLVVVLVVSKSPTLSVKVGSRVAGSLLHETANSIAAIVKVPFKSNRGRFLLFGRVDSSTAFFLGFVVFRVESESRCRYCGGLGTLGVAEWFVV
jgi:hypothetical protein